MEQSEPSHGNDRKPDRSPRCSRRPRARRAERRNLTARDVEHPTTAGFGARPTEISGAARNREAFVAQLSGFAPADDPFYAEARTSPRREHG